jgi:hypothetical protein
MFCLHIRFGQPRFVDLPAFRKQDLSAHTSPPFVKRLSEYEDVTNEGACRPAPKARHT